MDLTVQIVEDDPLAANDLRELITENGFLVSGIAKTFNDAINLFDSHTPDILLVDITLKGTKTGIDFVNYINKPTPVCPIVYLTGIDEEDLKSKAFESDPYAYLTKPYNSRNVIVSLELAFEKFNKRRIVGVEDSILFVKTGNQFKKVKVKDILFIQADGSYSKVVTMDSKYLLSGNLTSFSDRLSGKFIRVHRSFLINRDQVSSIGPNIIHINDYSIPVGRKYKELIKELID